MRLLESRKSIKTKERKRKNFPCVEKLKNQNQIESKWKINIYF